MANNEITDMEIRAYEPLRIESQKLMHVKGTKFSHGHLTDVSGKKQTFENVDFSYSGYHSRLFSPEVEYFRGCEMTDDLFICNKNREENPAKPVFNRTDLTLVKPTSIAFEKMKCEGFKLNYGKDRGSN